MNYLVEDEVKLYKERLIEVFKSFISFCAENNLKWCCCGGTMIGVVRHQDIIPWDDDIDIFMPREDYNRILSMSSELRKKGYDVVSIRNNECGPIPAKFYDCNTTLWEIKEIPFSYGVYIDLFPLDQTDDTQRTFKHDFRKFYIRETLYQLSLIKFSWDDFMTRVREGDRNFALKSILSIFVPGFLQKNIRKSILKLDDRLNKGVGTHYGCYHGDYWEKDYYDKMWFDDMVVMPFHGFEVFMPKGYDNYLRRVYGNYMQLPPKEKQITHHYHYYMNLERHYTIEEIKRMNSL